jgi:type II secretory pathway pseudopilin PulG
MGAKQIGGFTLIEVILSVVLIGFISMVVFGAVRLCLRVQQNSDTRQELFMQASTAAERITREFRYATGVLQASDGILEFETPYLLDQDEQTERVKYQLSGGELLRAVDLGGGYQTPSVLAQYVTGFQVNYAWLKDTFDSPPINSSKWVVYDSPGKPGVRISQGELEMRGKGTGEVGVRSVGQFERRELRVEASFECEDGGPFNVLQYGTWDPTDTCYLIEFANLGPTLRTIYFICNLDGVQVERVELGSWVPLGTYRLKLRMAQEGCDVYMDLGNGFSKVHSSKQGDFTPGYISLRPFSADEWGWWDDLSVVPASCEFTFTLSHNDQTYSLKTGSSIRTK